ncbi:ABC transporter permease [Terrarubrum flagellatum]|uniref:ABC transporter permease n=1 Tax=Terrirubrum flagellatum TaxID=2895980 RepID=UPI0031455B40
MSAVSSTTAHHQALRRRFKGFLPALPIVVLLGVVFFYPVLSLLSISVTEPQFGFQHYQRLLAEPIYLQIVWRTTWIALVVTAATAIIGYPLAFYLTAASPMAARIAMLALFVPFWASILVRAYGIMVIMGRNGLLNNALIALGVIDRPIQFLFNTWVVQAAMIQILLPFFVLPLYGVMKTIDPNLTGAARGLGASSLQAFARIYFPLTLPGVYAGSLIVLVFSFGFFIVPSMLGGRRDVTLPMLVITQFEGQINWGFGAAIGVVLLVGTLMIIFAVSKLAGTERIGLR